MIEQSAPTTKARNAMQSPEASLSVKASSMKSALSPLKRDSKRIHEVAATVPLPAFSISAFLS